METENTNGDGFGDSHNGGSSYGIPETRLINHLRYEQPISLHYAICMQ